MACLGEGILTDIAQRLMDKTIKEVNYFRHFETHVHNFVQDNNNLVARRKKVQNDIEDAKKRNENQIEDEVQNWIEEADHVIQENTKIKQTWSYGWCPYWQYRQGKRLAQRMPTIRDHIQKCNFERVARPSELPSIKYHAVKDFIDFESRKAKFKQLVEALEDGNCYMIGLQGMGGTGKTTLATQVGKQVEDAKAFEKVIFVVVSNPPDVNKIRGDIARQLGLHLEERVEADHSKFLWSRISNNERKLLIILDDLWGELNLTNIGIPSGLDHKNCYVLITTRHSKVCQSMRCQQIVHLHTLADEDAVHLFLFHATSDDDESSSNGLEGLARAFVKECGGLPIAIVALASTLRNWPVGEWNVALTTLQNSKPFVDVDEDLVKVYRCLRLSYDNLNNEKAQKLFLLCSIFPEDYEIPTNLIIRLGIGSKIFGEVDEYCVARSQILAVKNQLIAYSLLLKVEDKDCVKMHDLVREVAQWIAKEDIQVIVDSRQTLKENKRFVSWCTDDFPDQFNGTKLEILLLKISGNVLVKDPEAFFAGMSKLKSLFLLHDYDRKVPTSSLSKSLLSLKKIQTLILDGWEIGDISVLKNLHCLVTLELKNCLIIELPKDIMELKKLRWLGLRKCEIQKNNPFDVIERCSQLEELYFVRNYNVKGWKPNDDKEIEDEIASDISPSALQMFSIACDGFKCFANDDNGLLKCFNLEHIKHLISKAMFKYLVGRVEVLELGKIGQMRWKSLVPDLIPVEDGGMNNLTKLYLYEGANIECLIDNSKHHYSNITVFSKLVELHLYVVDVKKLYWGTIPPSFLEQLQILKLKECMELQSIFLDENLKLPQLRVLEMRDCPMLQPSIFQLSVAQSLMRLEELVIEGCDELISLIAYESLEEEIIVVDSQMNYGSLFPELKSLQIKRCGILEMVSSLLLAGDLPMLKDLYIEDCEELKYIFGEYRDMGQGLQQEIMLPLLTEVQLYEVPSFINIFQKCKKCMSRLPQILKEDSMEKYENSKTSAFSWAHGCCFMAPTKDTNIRVSNATLEQCTISQESCISSKMIETFHTAECLVRQPLSLQNIRKMTLERCSKLKSLFSVSIATTIMLEELYIERCEELKHIITNDEEDDDNLNSTSIFPKLQQLEVSYCNKLEFIFSLTLSGGLQKLKSIVVNEAQELKYVFGKYKEEECLSNENENNKPHIDLPALETLNLTYVPNMISIGIKKYQLKYPSLHSVEAPKEIKEQMQEVTSEGAKEYEIQEIVNVGTPLTPSVGFQYFLNFHNMKEIDIWINKKLKTLFSITACRNLPQLFKLYISDCEELVNVVEDDSNDDHHMNYSSIFPKLEYLNIYRCNKLKFIFPFSLFGSLQKLKSLRLVGAAELNYIFGKCHDGDLSNENESEKLLIHLPALEQLAFIDVPKIINNIRTEKYQLSFPPLERIELGDLQEFNKRSFPDLMAYLQLSVKAPKDLMNIIREMQNLTRLGVNDFKIEEVLNLEGVEIEGPVMTLSLEEMWLKNLSELRHICKGPKYILSLQNLRILDITACKKLRSIFCVSIVKSLPKVYCLRIQDCDELVDIIEESADDHLHQLCFPSLDNIFIKRCKRLKCLFSISTPFMLPKLKDLTIEKSNELEQVFIHKQDDIENMVVEDVFPMLSKIELRKLPMLVAICEGIDFQTVLHLEVDDCPKYQGGSYYILDSEEELSVYTEETSGSPNLTEDFEDEHKTSESIMQPQQEDLGETKTTKASHKTNIPPFDDNGIEDVGLQSGPSTLNYKETEKEAVRVVLDPASKLLATTLSASEITHSIKEITEPSLQENHAAEDALAAILSTNSNSRKQSTRPFVNSINDSVQRMELGTSLAESQLRKPSQHELDDEQSTCEATSLGRSQDLGETKISIEVPHKTKIPFDDDSIDVIIKERVQESSTSKDVVLETLFADLAPRNLSAASITTLQEKFPLDLAKKESRSRTIMTNQQALTEKISVRDGNVQAKTEISFIYSQAESSEFGPSTMSVKSIQEETTAMGAKIDASSFYSHVEGSQSSPSMMIYKEVKQKVGKVVLALPAKSTSFDLEVTTKETRDANVQDGSESKKAKMANLLTYSCDFKSNIPTEDNTSLHNVIPSSHHQSQTGAAGSSSPILEIGEILELMELKDGEAALLIKALELYPQLRLSHGQRTRQVIAFSYRVLVDILVMLDTKTPCTITTSDKSTLEENLGTTTFLGFDKGWIKSVRDKVYGIDMFDVTVVEEEIQVIKAELETCDITLEQVRKQRVEIKEQIASVISQLEMVKSEFEAIDSQLWGLLEDREKLIKKMMEFRAIISAQGRPFGI